MFLGIDLVTDEQLKQFRDLKPAQILEAVVDQELEQKEKTAYGRRTGQDSSASKELKEKMEKIQIELDEKLR